MSKVTVHRRDFNDFVIIYDDKYQKSLELTLTEIIELREVLIKCLGDDGKTWRAK